MPQDFTADTTVSLDNLMEMVGDDLETIKDIVMTFFEDSPTLLGAIAEGINNQDASLAERSAHTLKSSCRLFQANQFADQCQHLENTVKQEDWETAQTVIAELQQKYVVIAQVLKTKLEQM